MIGGKKNAYLWLIIRLMFSVSLMIGCYVRFHNHLAFYASLLELICLSLLLYTYPDNGKRIGKIVLLILYALFNLQNAVRLFANSFTTLLMLQNVVFISELKGYFLDIILIACAFVFCSCIPIRNYIRQHRKVSISIALIGEILLFTPIFYGAAPLSATFDLCVNAVEYMVDSAKLKDINANAEDFYCSTIEDGISKPEVLNENPNVILVFMEGLSENVILDSQNIMPNLREIRDNSLHFTNYYNHTFATLRGLIGQLYSGYQRDNFDNNELISLQSIFESAGYSTTIINTEPNNQPFINYLQNMRFEQFISENGSIAEYLADGEAYELLWDTVSKQENENKPFFTVMYSFGTHVSFDSPEEQYGDGSNPLLNRFYNLDCNIGTFMRRFLDSDLVDNTVIIFTTDHATYYDKDFQKSFQNYDRLHPELDAIPLLIYSPGVEGQEIDVNGRNSLSLAPTILDFLDIEAPNYFLGKSLFCDPPESNIDTYFTDSTTRASTYMAEIVSISSAEARAYDEILNRYFACSAKKVQNTLELETSMSADNEVMTLSIEDQGYSRIWFAVWSEENGSDDLQFASAELIDNQWKASVEMRRHNDVGIYQIHVYTGG